MPGKTVDAIFEWTGKDLGWDIFGTPVDGMPAHTCSGATTTIANPGTTTTTRSIARTTGSASRSCCPKTEHLAFGGFWSGSPFLGVLSALLPPGQGGLNPNAGFTFMWHSHTEKELTNCDIFPGGMMTMLVIVPRGTTITPAP